MTDFLADRAQKLREGAADVEKLLIAIEGARMQLSSTSDELRGQTTAIAARVRWMISELDALKLALAGPPQSSA